jgi:hypothetical protein
MTYEPPGNRGFFIIARPAPPGGKKTGKSGNRQFTFTFGRPIIEKEEVKRRW